MVNITSINSGKTAATGLSVQWDEGQFVMIIADKGLVSCGIIDKEVVDKVGYAAAIAYGTPEKQLVTVKDLLEAKIKVVSGKAKEYGIQAEMTGEEALLKLSEQ